MFLSAPQVENGHTLHSQLYTPTIKAQTKPTNTLIYNNLNTSSSPILLPCFFHVLDYFWCSALTSRNK